jgi:cytochrome c peroxidase
MKHSMKTLMVAAAVSGMLSGAATMQAATTQTTNPVVKVGKASFSGVSLDKPAKHSCKGKNDCKGQGGCKSSDNGCKAKNSCKGKGGCATDGSKPPSA